VTKLSFILCFSVLCILLFSFTACEKAAQVTAPADMAGTWVGLGHHTLTSEFLDQKEIPVMLIITQAGDITGYIGDASIQKTALQKTAWWLKLLGKAKYRSIIELRGNIVNNESFSRDGGTLFFQKFSPEAMICVFTSTGSQVDEKNLTITIKDIALRHAE